MASLANTQTAAEHTRGARRFQPQDFAWLLFVVVLIATAPETNYNQRILLILIGLFQIIEPRLKLFSSSRGEIASVALKLLLSYLLVGWTHGIASNYYAIFLIPVVSAATLFSLSGVIIVTALACIGYFSFLLPIFVDYSIVPPEFLRVMGLHASFYAIVAILVYQQAKAKRDEMQRTQAAAAGLAAANQELHEAQASLRRSERLAALGQLTAGLAHELRNPLGTIKASAEMLMKPAAKNRPELRDEMAGFIRSEVDRINGLVSSFLDFARPLQIHPVMADLRSVFEQVERSQAGLADSKGVRLSIKRYAGDLAFPFDPDLLRVALTNLTENAIQASAPGQEVELRADVDARSVNILVRDAGEGIAPENIESIFNPFFTTKPQGVGLGLALVAKIVDEHGGRIDVQSEPGKGTAFAIALPKHGAGI